MKSVSVVRVLVCGAFAVACDAAAPADPLREAFLDACQVNPDQVRIEEQSNGRVTTESYCKCAYDKTMRGLSEQERSTAAFYLLVQVGVDERDAKRRLPAIDYSAMGAASAAIGRMTQQCRTR